MKRTYLTLGLFALLVAACGSLLPSFGEDEPAPSPTPQATDAAADDVVVAADGASDAEMNEAAVGSDGGLVCIASKQCADDELECCSGQRGSGCTMKCEIVCCL